MSKISIGPIRIAKFKRSKISWRCSVVINKPRLPARLRFKEIRRIRDDFYQSLIFWAFHNAIGKFRPYSFGNTMGIDFVSREEAIQLKEYLESLNDDVSNSNTR